MTNKIIETAREAGQYADAEYRRAWEEASDGASWQQNRDARFYAIAFKAGMERAAEICEAQHEEDRPGDYAAAIRAHAQNQPESIHDTGNVSKN